MKLYQVLLALVSCVLILPGCSRETVEPAADPNHDEAAPLQLVIYNWEDYLGSGTTEAFTELTGIEVTEVHFEDEEEMLGAVQASSGAFDLVVPSDDAVREMIEARMLLPLDYDKIPNMHHLGADFINQHWDPDQMYSVAYLWGTTGVVANTKFVDVETMSIDVLFDPAYAGRIGMPTDPWDAAAAAAKSLGFSIQTTDTAQWETISEKMNQQSKIVHGYHDLPTLQELVIDEEIWAAMIYSGEGLATVDVNDNLVYYIPVEGAPRWVDLFVIPRDAPHPDEAHQFLNFILDPEVNAAIASEYWYATANRSAEEFMESEVLDDPGVYPSADVLGRLEFYSDVGSADQILNRTWAEIELGE